MELLGQYRIKRQQSGMIESGTIFGLREAREKRDALNLKTISQRLLEAREDKSFVPDLESFKPQALDILKNVREWPFVLTKNF